MESSLAMRLRSVEKVIELKADFQTASITNQTLNRKGNCKNRKGHEEKLCRLTILKSELISVEKWEADLCAI